MEENVKDNIILDINENHVESLLKDIEEIIKLLTSIVKSSQENNK